MKVSRIPHAVLLATLLGVAAAGTASGQMVRVDIAAFDPDKDGTIDLKEAETAAGAAFDKLDPDKDGTLDAKELTGRMSAEEIKLGDPDRDGTLDKKEYLDLVRTHFKAADPDNDGTVNAAELAGPAGSALVTLMR